MPQNVNISEFLYPDRKLENECHHSIFITILKIFFILFQ